MTDQIRDLRRELEKARHALDAAQSHLAAHAQMNAALHCSAAVMYSPLHAKVAAAIAGIDHALARTEEDPEAAEQRKRDGRLLEVLSDLDRCEHGRHEGDPCVGCRGDSHGNPLLPPGGVIGCGLRGNPIVMPHRDDKHDPAAWRGTPAVSDA